MQTRKKRNARVSKLKLRIKLDRERDGRWLAEIPQLPGVMVYAPTRAGAIAKVEALALRVIADRIEHGEASAQRYASIFLVSKAA
ncbi:MAG: type II toxin-antitoxin system HicB family antitoxin [Candidatus Binataceae bacterium]